MAKLDVESYWLDSAKVPTYPSLKRDLSVDVAIVGAGITGLTAGYLVKRAGRTVAVVDRDRVGGVDTMRTTAHVTCVTDLDLTDLDKNFGRSHAQAAYDAGLAAIDQLDAIIRDEEIACDWAWVTGYKHLPIGVDSKKETERLRDEAQLAEAMGFDASFVAEVPWLGRPGIAYDAQAKIHPRKYLARLASIVNGDGSFVFEHTTCDEVVDDPLSIKVGGHTIRCQYVVLATHTPLMGKTNIASATLLQTKLYLYTSYAVGGHVPSGIVPEALFWDTADPYQYIRIDRHDDHDYVIVGGADHKTGQVTDTTACFRAVEDAARRLLPSIEITHRWSGQVIQTNDGLPLIGETSEKQFAATGYAGNGMTFGTLAGMMARDAALGLKNPWKELFDVGRTKVRGGAWDYIKENVDYPYYMVRDRFAGAEGKSLRVLQRGQGKILSLDGQQVAAWRDELGRVTLLSPTCTHMGCTVGWNAAERTWDCPCHGSRFTATGAVLAGPAESPLEPVTGKASKSSPSRPVTTSTPL